MGGSRNKVAYGRCGGSLLLGRAIRASPLSVLGLRRPESRPGLAPQRKLVCGGVVHC